MNVEDGSLFDEDESLNAELIIRWDIDIEKDANKNGILDDDYVLPKPTAINNRVPALWNESGYLYT